MSSMGLSVDWTWPRQESLNRKTCLYKRPKLKCKQKKEWKKKELWDNYTRCNTCTKGIPEGEERKEEIFLKQ